MRKIMLALAIVLCFSSMALAQYPYGNNYNTQGNTTYGTNTQTGSNWQTTHQAGGNMSGMDARGNSWNYDRSTGTYQNYGTREVRQHGKRVY